MHRVRKMNHEMEMLTVFKSWNIYSNFISAAASQIYFSLIINNSSCKPWNGKAAAACEDAFRSSY